MYAFAYAYSTGTLTNYDRPQWKNVFSQLAADHAGERVRRESETLLHKKNTNTQEEGGRQGGEWREMGG